MKGTSIFLIFMCVLLLAAPAYAGSQKVINDDAPDNLVNPNAFYDYRDHGGWSGFVGGSEARSGGYFLLSCQVELGGLLDDYYKVMKINAEHEQTGLEFSLIREECTDPSQGWYLLLRPEDWMLKGTWKFIMFYEDSDGKKYKQVAKHEMGPVAFPTKPTNVNLARMDDGSVTVSWSAIGIPYNKGPFDYRIRIYDENNCTVKEFLGKWRGDGEDYSGEYDGALNKVIFKLPGEYAGHYARLENRFLTQNQMSRACQYITIRGSLD